jgi:hypothetical protein
VTSSFFSENFSEPYLHKQPDFMQAGKHRFSDGEHIALGFTFARSFDKEQVVIDVEHISGTPITSLIIKDKASSRMAVVACSLRT